MGGREEPSGSPRSRRLTAEHRPRPSRRRRRSRCCSAGVASRTHRSRAAWAAPPQHTPQAGCCPPSRHLKGGNHTPFLYPSRRFHHPHASPAPCRSRCGCQSHDRHCPVQLALAGTADASAHRLARGATRCKMTMLDDPCRGLLIPFCPHRAAHGRHSTAQPPLRAHRSSPPPFRGRRLSNPATCARVRLEIASDHSLIWHRCDFGRPSFRWGHRMIHRGASGLPTRPPLCRPSNSCDAVRSTNECQQGKEKLQGG